MTAAPLCVIERRCLGGRCCMDRSDACMAHTRFFPTNVVTFRCGQHAPFKVCCVHYVRLPPFKSVLHQGRSHIVSSSHVENDAVPCAQLPCVICLLAMRCSTKVDRKPFGCHVPNRDAPHRPGSSAQYERPHVRCYNLCRLDNKCHPCIFKRCILFSVGLVRKCAHCIPP